MSTRPLESLSQSLPLKIPVLSPPCNSGLKFRILQKIARFTRKHQPRGTDRFLRLIYSPDKRQKDHLSITMEYDAQLLFHIDTASWIEWYLFFYGYYEPELTDLIKRLFRPGFVVFDVGANNGCHTLIMALMAGDSGKVFAVEPCPKVFEKLVKNISLNGMKNIIPMSCAFSDAAGTSTFYGFEEGASNEAVSSLYASNAGEHPVEFQVDVNTLDHVARQEKLSRLDFVKIDAEGHEYQVLMGAKESVAKYRPYVVFEYAHRTWSNSGADFNSAQSFFHDNNYTLYEICPHYLTEVKNSLSSIHANILAVPNLSDNTSFIR